MTIYYDDFILHLYIWQMLLSKVSYIEFKVHRLSVLALLEIEPINARLNYKEATWRLSLGSVFLYIYIYIYISFALFIWLFWPKNASEVLRSQYRSKWLKCKTTTLHPNWWMRTVTTVSALSSHSSCPSILYLLGLNAHYSTPFQMTDINHVHCIRKHPQSVRPLPTIQPQA